ncbi:MAG: hypothetical protein A2722_01780 [Candidatus Doudnabacteria bacterium RIFCSPHIGHO2_01_FULL_50_11]|uniref:Adenylate kinase n=1 Tax=Candidatus Doudnabacteria bacterium RIFCSPHIGHO2_01_FULL_50_11 TaxID=1817828 RepID=A0A1F5PMR7_9BACT|nr:MAG: hypothetical protein A2722_01780 [Candidatus Doudnabacteria bacterium RIFCSPHIGHO2_01_FULL_50_11]HLC44678.1 nucleoside monophosphate kinase [Patescibacteria group bacterium]
MKPTKTLNIIFFGPQGSGKGTQAKLLAARLGLRHLSSGEALRQTAKQKTPLGRYLARQLPTGTLTPVPKLLRVFETHIRRIPVTQGIIFDGFARQISETRIFLRRLKAMGRNLDLAIMIGIVSSETIRRLNKRVQCDNCSRIFIVGGKIKAGARCPICGGTLIHRLDDTPEAIRKRLKMYRKRTIPVIRFFKKQRILELVSGQHGISKVHANILKVLKRRGLAK